MAKLGRFLGIVTLLGSASLLLFGCSKKAGDSCSGSQVRCESSSRALECVQGKFADVACLGPAGCIEAANRCDRTKAAAGDACDGDWAACTADSKQFLQCKANKLTVTATCSGPKGCSARGNELLCDQTRASAGDVCSGEGTSCALDGKSLLKCQAGKFAVSVACRGADGCSTAANHTSCDQSLALPGDPCEGSGGACDVSGKQLLQCDGKKLAPAGFCRGTDGCKLVGSSVHCDQSLGVVGDPCDGSACAVDGTALLECAKGKLAFAKKCHTCSAIGQKLSCG